MRIVANENMPRGVIAELRNRGHDVFSIKESMRGATDESILSLADAEQRLVVTQDKDFGELAFRLGLPASCGVVLFRLSGDNPDVDIQRMIDVIDARNDWAGHFSVVDNARIRMRPLL